DALFVIDDFLAVGALADAARMHRDADRVLRSQGNGVGRSRMRSDTSIRPDKPPRGLIVSTGEDIPRGQSLRARMLILELAPNALNWERLTKCQEDASAGAYALAMAGYVQWVAAHYDEARKAVRPDVARAAALVRNGQVGRISHSRERHHRTNDATTQL